MWAISKTRERVIPHEFRRMTKQSAAVINCNNGIRATEESPGEDARRLPAGRRLSPVDDMKKTRRSSQVGDTVRTELSLILQRELNDPSLGFLTVTDVEMSPDLKYAKVFISSLSDPSSASEAVKNLVKGRARIRHLLAQRANLRYTPELDFRLDQTALQASSIEQILHDVLPAGQKENDDHDDDNDNE
jgi:ribosome-binding factor A